MPDFMSTVAQLGFFNELTKVLIAFDVRGSHIIYYISLIVYSALLIFNLILFVLLYFGLPKDAVLKLFFPGSILDILDKSNFAVLSFDVFLLSELTIFSTAEKYFPPKYKRLMKIFIFLLSFGVLMEIVLQNIDEIIYIRYPTSDGQSKYIDYYQNINVFLNEHFIEFVILAIIYILSNPDYNDEKSKELSNIDIVLNESLI